MNWQHEPAYERELLLHLLQANGLKEEDLNRAEKIISVEMVLDDYTSMKTLKYLPYLKSVCLIQQAIPKLEGLETATELERLLLNENIIERLDGLQNCTRLKKLYLSCNCIKELGNGLSGLKQLEVFWVAENHLTNLDGLSEVTSLTELNAARNRISTVVGAFDKLPKLQVINLAGNRICSFKEVLDLARLPKLTELNFADPDWGENPICLLCNYQVYTLYHIPSLKIHDRMVISQDDHASAEATFYKKRLFYNMRIKMFKRQAADGLRAAKVLDEERRASIALDLDSAERTLRRAEGFFAARRDNEIEAQPPEEDESELQDRIEIQRRLEQIQVELQDAAIAWHQLEVAMEAERDTQIRNLLLELQSGGNVRFEVGVPDRDPWASQIKDLVLARFRPEQFHQFGIKDMKVQTVTRLQHRSLRIRFDELLERLDADGLKQVEHLFYVPEARRSVEDIREASEGGFGDEFTEPDPIPRTSPSDSSINLQEPATFLLMGRSSYRRLLLTNSVSLAEAARLENYVSTDMGQALKRAVQRTARLQRERATATSMIRFNDEVLKRPPALSGVLLLCSAYLSDQEPDRPQRFDSHCFDVHELLEKQPSRPHQGKSSPTESPPASTNNVDVQARPRVVYRTREDDPKTKVWHVSWADAVLPEYLIELEYVPLSEALQTQVKHLEGNFGSFTRLLREYGVFARLGVEERPKTQRQSADPTAQETTTAPEAPSHWPKVLSELPRIERLEASTLHLSRLRLFHSDAVNFHSLRVLNLHDRHLRRIEASVFEELTGLSTLLLSFNSIESTGALAACPSLTKLDLSHNLLQKVSSLEGFPCLKDLDLSWNMILSLEVMSIISRDIEDLETFAIAGNPVALGPKCRLTALAKLHSLRCLDGEDVDEDELSVAGREIEHRLSKELVLKHSYAPSISGHGSGDSGPRRPPLPGSLGYDPLKDKVSKLITGANWMNHVEILDLRRLGLTSLIGLPNLPRCQSLRVCDNQLTSLEGITSLPKLEELFVERNGLANLGGLSQLQELQRLDAGGNHITDVLDLQKLGKLRQLSLEDNFVDSLDTFAQLHGLMELYLSNNVVEELRSVLLLKQLPKLIILDLSGNDLAVAPEYRFYTMFHLRKLKVLDGLPVTQAELQEADEKFSGKITMELLEDKLGPSPSCYSFRTVDLSGQGLRELGMLLNDDIFPSLRELILDNNPFSDIRNVGPLSKLLVLRMNKTKIDLDKGMKAEADSGGGISSMPHLQVLEMGYSGITDLSSFAQFPLASLRILHLSGNELTKIEGLAHLEQLRELVIDKNKVKQFDEKSFEGLKALRELRAEDNGLKSLANIGPLPRLRALYLSSNRISELSELEHLRHLRHVLVVHLSQNPVARKPLYRAHLIHAIASVRAIDGKEVTEEERDRVDQILQISDPSKSNGVYIFNEPPSAGVQLSYVTGDGPKQLNLNTVTPSFGGPVSEGRRSILQDNPAPGSGPSDSGKRPNPRAHSAPRHSGIEYRSTVAPSTGR